MFVVQEDADCPSIGELIDLLEAAQIAHKTGSEAKTVAEILTERFTSKYPHIQINRPSRFLDTVNRLAAPTKPSSIGEAKLSGSPLAHYRRRQWSPRNRCKQGIGCLCVCKKFVCLHKLLPYMYKTPCCLVWVLSV